MVQVVDPLDVVTDWTDALAHQESVEQMCQHLGKLMVEFHHVQVDLDAYEELWRYQSKKDHPAQR